MGGCGCPEPETCGCFFESSADVTAVGSGSMGNPIALMLAAGKLPFLYGASDDLPPNPRLGQPVFESDTGMVVVWDGTIWRPVSTAGIRSFSQTGVLEASSWSWPGPNVIAVLNIPDPGYPYLLLAWGRTYLLGGVNGDNWNVGINDDENLLNASAHVTMIQTSVAGILVGSDAIPPSFVAVPGGGKTLTLSATAAYGGHTLPGTSTNPSANKIYALIIPS